MDDEYLLSKFTAVLDELDLNRHPGDHQAVNAALDRLAAVDGHRALKDLPLAARKEYDYALRIVARRKRIPRGFVGTPEDFGGLTRAIGELVRHFRRAVTRSQRASLTVGDS